MRSAKNFVAVLWLDAWFDDETFTELDDDACKGYITESVGYAVIDDDRGIMLARDYYPDIDQATYRHRHFIPREYIISVKRLFDV